MKKIVNVLVILSAVPLLGLGLTAMFSPTTALKEFELQAVGMFGLSQVRGLIGGTFLSGATMIFLGLFTKNKAWYYPVLLIVSYVVLGRIISFLLDGWSNTILPGFIIEALIVGALFLAIRQPENK